MTRVLILAYTFPPYISVGGLRPYSWYKYLNEYEVYPIVVTRQWQNNFASDLDYVSPGYSDSVETKASTERTLIEAPFKPNLADRLLLKYGANKFKLFRKLITAYYEFLQFILPIGGKRNIYLAADEFLKENKVDLIIATGDPFILFKYASELGKKHSIPWIADYRDAWIQDTSMSNKLYKIWCAFFEKRILENVYKITTVSTFIQKQIEQNIKGKDFDIIYNGFDPEIPELTKDIKQCNESLTIALVGTIYNWHPIESFLRSCNEILVENPGFKLELYFYGINNADEIQEMLREKFSNLEAHTHIRSKIPNLQLMKEISTHNVLLLFNYYSMLGTKIFDYLAIKRKMILCYEDDEEANKIKEEFYCISELESESKSLQADMIKATNSGIVVKDSKHLKEVILALSNELREKGFIECDSIKIDEYSRIKQVEKLAGIVKEARNRQ